MIKIIPNLVPNQNYKQIIMLINSSPMSHDYNYNALPKGKIDINVMIWWLIYPFLLRGFQYQLLTQKSNTFLDLKKQPVSII